MDTKKELIARLNSAFPGAEEQIAAILEDYRITRESGREGGLEKRIAVFLAAKKIDGLSPKTLKNYREMLEAFAARVDKPAGKISADDIREYVGYLVEKRRLKDSSVQTHINTLRSFFGWLDAEDIIKKNPMRKIKSLKIDRAKARRPLTAEQLERLLTKLKALFDFSTVREFTVEAGRPDTITADKLETLKKHGIHRISINPQSMEDQVLRAMGRSHTAGEIVEAMALAEEHFGGLVNMDLIAGLPADSREGFGRTLERVLAMGPENITVHTLSLKKGSRMTEQGGGLPDPASVEAMLALASERLRGAGYAPYYLYRQKYMSGSFENVGWAKPGTESLYNIVMMEELQSVLSLGAGGVTKLIRPGGQEILRLANPKYPQDYLSAREKILGQKAELSAFFQGQEAL